MNNTLKVILTFIGCYMFMFAIFYYLPKRGETVPLKPSAWLALPSAAYLTWRIYKEYGNSK